MKLRLNSMILTLLFALTTQAAVNPQDKAFSFKYRLRGQSFEVSQKAPSYEEAFEKAAQACFKHYKSGRTVAEEEGLDIIDVCANPKS